jgi:hypothetical protein
VIDQATSALVGVWRIAAFEDRDDEHSAWVSYGSDPRGIIIYDRTGTISVHLIAEGPMPSSSGYIGYWGTFRVVEADRQADGIVGTVEHHMEGGSMPDLFEEGVERPFSLQGDRLTLGDGRTARRLLERIR